MVLQESVEEEQKLTAPEQFKLLQRSLFLYPNQNSHIKVFHCLEMKHPQAEGVQRVRCFPFKSHKWQKGEKTEGRNLTDPVFLMPLEAKEDFSLPEDTALLHYGRVVLFFSILIPGRMGHAVEVDCAFVKYFDEYKARGKSMCTACVLSTQYTLLSTHV